MRGLADEEVRERREALGIGFVWTGVESKSTPLKKCAHEDTRAYLDELAAADRVDRLVTFGPG